MNIYKVDYQDQKQKSLNTLLKHDTISARNKELILSWFDYLKSKGTGDSRINKLCIHFLVLLPGFVDLDKCAKENLVSLIANKIESSKLAESTKGDYRRSIKQFYNWFNDEDMRLESQDHEQRIIARKLYKYLKEVKRGPRSVERDPSQVINDQDCVLLIDKGCYHPQERAFIGILHESGFRAGEFLSMRIKDVQFDENGTGRVYCPESKTFSRWIDIFLHVKDLRNWIEIHPHRDNPNAPLWVNTSNFKRHEPMLYRGAVGLIERVAEKAGMIKVDRFQAKTESGKKYNHQKITDKTKPVNFHWFRHSRASILGEYMPEQILCKYMGWYSGSKESKTYCHTNDKQVTNSFMRMHGIETKEKEKNTPVKCPICSNLNPAESAYCSRCYRPVTRLAQNEINKELEKSISLIMKISQNPELMKQFQDFCGTQTQR